MRETGRSSPDSDALPGTPRERARERTMADIVRIGRAHLARDGAAALSLRAVARDLGVVSSAVYRYVPNRDALLTMLIEDAYAELGAAVEESAAAAPPGRHRRRWLAAARAVRRWALAEPARYGLLYGAPVPGYAAPPERTTAPGIRVVRLLLTIVRDAHTAGAVVHPPAAHACPDGSPRGDTPPPEESPGVASPGQPTTGEVAADMRRIRDEVGIDLPEELVVRAGLAWVALFGAVSFEVFGQYGPDTLHTPATLFEHHLGLLADLIGLSDHPEPPDPA